MMVVIQQEGLEHYFMIIAVFPQDYARGFEQCVCLIVNSISLIVYDFFYASLYNLDSATETWTAMLLVRKTYDK